MSQGIQPDSLQQSVENGMRHLKGDDAKVLAALYDEYAGVVLGFLEKLADDKDKAEELLQVVFLALPSRLNEFDPQKGRLVVWILNLARSLATSAMNGRNVATNEAIQTASQNVSEANTASTRPLKRSDNNRNGEKDRSVIELLYVKGYTFAGAAAELGVDENAVKTLVRTELKKYRKADPNA